MIQVKELKQTTDACPAQWYGSTTDGKIIYIRYRHGKLRCDIDGETYYQIGYGGEWDGAIEEVVMQELLSGVLQFPK